jgi:hypothetical protein
MMIDKEEFQFFFKEKNILICSKNIKSWNWKTHNKEWDIKSKIRIKKIISI